MTFLVWGDMRSPPPLRGSGIELKLFPLRGRAGDCEAEARSSQPGRGVNGWQFQLTSPGASPIAATWIRHPAFNARISAAVSQRPSFAPSAADEGPEAGAVPMAVHGAKPTTGNGP
jgi:hypothetical protein